MINYPLMIIIMLISIELANAQENNDQQQQQTPTSSNLQPSLFVVIGVLSFMFTLTLILLIYAKFFHTQPTPIHSITRNGNGNTQQNNGVFGSNTRFSGIDKAVVESLPFFRFASLKGSKQGLQCAVCLAEFQDFEILRLLPKCKHGFHIECVDLWLERHSTCPLCRQRVSADDLISFTNSSSLRFININNNINNINNKPECGETEEASSSFELFLERHERDDIHSTSSMFSIGGSFRRNFSSTKSDEQENEIITFKLQQQNNNNNNIHHVLHKVNHQIVVSDVVFKNRWSDVSSSDLMFLNSEMLGVNSSRRFPSSNNLLLNYHSGEEITGDDKTRELFDQIKMSCSNAQHSSDTNSNTSFLKAPRRRSSLIPGDKRAMSEITAFSRFKDLMSRKNKLRQCLANSEINNNYNNNNSDNDDDYVREDLINRRKKWFPIAKRTVQWFANREKYRSQQHQFQHSQTLDV